MNEEMLQQVLTRMDTLASKLGVAAGTIYQAALKQSYVETWLSISTIGLTVVLFGVMFLAAHKIAAQCHKRAHHPDVTDYWVPFGLATLLGTVVVGLAILILDYQITQFLTNWLNPEWAAIKRLKP